MKTWVRYRRGCARYTGGISRAPFVAWLETPEGRAVLDKATSRTRFAFLASARAARRLWRRLAASAREPRVIVAIQSEMVGYLGRLQEFVYADGLTRDPITRALRKKVTAAVERIEASLPSLSRTERNEILRRALRGN